MAGSPKKRARREAARKLAEAASAEPGNLSATAIAPAGSADAVATHPAGAPTTPEAPQHAADSDPRDTSPVPTLPAPVSGEVLPPERDVTNTALKRAMRRKAGEYAERAVEVLATAMESPDPRIAVPAAREILDRSIGKPTPEIEIGEGGLSVTIIRFGDQ